MVSLCNKYRKVHAAPLRVTYRTEQREMKQE